MMSDFRSDDSFPVKTGGCPTHWLTPHSTRNKVIWKIYIFIIIIIGKVLFLRKIFHDKRCLKIFMLKATCTV